MAEIFAGWSSNRWDDVIIVYVNGERTGYLSNFNNRSALPGSGTDVVVGGLFSNIVNIDNTTYNGFTDRVAARNLEIQAGYTLNANASQFIAYGALANNGQLYVNTDQIQIRGSTVENNGSIVVTAQGTGGNNSAVLMFGVGDVNLVGMGELRLVASGSSQASNNLSAQLEGYDPNNLSILNNYINITGKGTIGYNGNAGDPGGRLVLKNKGSGVINADRPDGSLTINGSQVSGSNPFGNEGLMKAENGGLLVFDRIALLDQTSSGRILADGAGRVDVYQSTIRGGSLETTNGGKIYLNGGTIIGAPFAPVTLKGDIRISMFDPNNTAPDFGNISATLQGNIRNEGTLKLHGYQTGLWIGSDGLTLTGGGQVVMAYNQTGDVSGAVIKPLYTNPNVTWTNVDNMIRGTGTIFQFSDGNGAIPSRELKIVNQAQGVFQADDTRNAMTFNGVDMVNAGTLRAINGAEMYIRYGDNPSTALSTNATIANPGGTILADGAGSRVNLSGTGTAEMTVQGGTLAGINGGEITLGNRTVLDGSTNQGSITLQGLIRNNHEGMLRGAIRNEGDIVFAAGDGESTLRIHRDGATLSGGGEIVLAQDKISGGAQPYTQLTFPIDPSTLPPPSVLTNENNLIHGWGWIGNASFNGTEAYLLRLVNNAGGVISGDVAANGTAQNRLIIGTGHTITNNGALEANGGTLWLKDQVTTGGELRAINGGTLIVRSDTADDISFSGTGSEKVTFSRTYIDGSLNEAALTTDINNPRDIFYHGTLRGMGVGDEVRTIWRPSGYNDSSDIEKNRFTWSKQGDIGTLSYLVDNAPFNPPDQRQDSLRFEGVERSQLEFFNDTSTNGIGIRRVYTVDGNAFDNGLIGTDGKDRLLGLGGNDRLIAAGANSFDIYDGGEGSDTADYSVHHAQGFVDAGGNRYGLSLNLNKGQDSQVFKYGTTFQYDLIRDIENVIGTDLADNLQSGRDTDNNRFEGRGGDDWFVSQGGNDTFVGGDGSDWFLMGEVGGGNFAYTFNAEGSGTHTNAERTVTFESMEGFYATSQSGDMRVTGNAQGNRIDVVAYAGSIALDGMGGNDILDADFNGAQDIPRSIVLRGGAGGDMLDGTGLSDALLGDDPISLTSAALSIKRLYITTLDRGPDEGGWLDWTGRLDAGQALTDIAAGFVGSQEFQTKYGALDNPAFVRQLYLNVLDREPDQAGFNAQLNALTSGAVTRTQLVVNFSESQELKNGMAIELHAGQVYRLYGATLARAPDAAGFETWTDALSSGRGLVDIAGGFVGSTEFQTRFPGQDSTGFVTLLYQNVLGRAPDAGGLSYWTGQLDTNAQTRTQVVIGFSESAEYINGTRTGTDSFMRNVMTAWSDTLVGGAGNDSLTGGRGSDRFMFTVGETGHDVIYGFESYDTLQLTGFGFANSAAALAAMAQQGSNVVLNHNGSSITFADTQLSMLQSMTGQGWVLS